MNSVTYSELKRIPYIARGFMTDQMLYNYPYFDDGKNLYLLPFANNDHKFTFLMAIPVESFYYARQTMDDKKDVFIEFFNILICQYSFSSINTCLGHIKNDVLNISAVLEKYFIYHNFIAHVSEKYSPFPIIIWTDIEYFFGLIRSLFDHMQILIKHFVKRYQKVELTSSFAGMLDEEKVELKSKYNTLPPKIKEYYENIAGFFFKCRDIRDKIYHQGMPKGSIFYFEDGFGIDENLFDFSNFNVWPKDKIKTNSIVSLLGLLSYISKTVIQNLNTLGLAIHESFTPTNPFISQDYIILLRGTCTEHLNKLDFYMTEQWVTNVDNLSTKKSNNLRN